MNILHVTKSNIIYVEPSAPPTIKSVNINLAKKEQL